MNAVLILIEDGTVPVSFPSVVLCSHLKIGFL